MNAPRTFLSDEEKAEILPKLKSPTWRIRNLYRIIDKFGREVKFVPTTEQNQLIDAIYVEGQMRHAILKARQMGFSTLIAVIIFDRTYWAKNISAAIVDQDQEAASKKLEKVKFAYDGLGVLRERLIEDNSRGMAFASGSSISAGKKTRGSTNQVLHVSEWGPIAHEDPKRSEEIKTGALPSAENGLIFVETTFKGGKGGHLYELLKTAMETPAHMRTKLDFRFWFFPWYLEKSYTLEGDPKNVSAAQHVYFDKMEAALHVRFTQGQRLWYAITAKSQGIFMRREYPTTEAEAFSAPVEGSVYGTDIDTLRAKGRIIPFEWDRSAPVFSARDIGWSDMTAVFLFQLVGLDVRIIWHTEQQHRTAQDIHNLLSATGIPIDGHLIPHDAASKKPGDGKNYRDSMVEAGDLHIILVPPIKSIWDGIDAARSMISRCYFNTTHCERGLECLEAYHVKNTTAGGIVTKEPVHDWSSHTADAFRYIAEGLQLGLIKTSAARRISTPRFADGVLVDMFTVQHQRALARRGKARSAGPTV